MRVSFNLTDATVQRIGASHLASAIAVDEMGVVIERAIIAWLDSRENGEGGDKARRERRRQRGAALIDDANRMLDDMSQPHVVVSKSLNENKRVYEETRYRHKQWTSQKL